MENAGIQTVEGTIQEEQKVENTSIPQEEIPNSNQSNVEAPSTEQNVAPLETNNDKSSKTPSKVTRSSAEESSAPLKESIARLQTEAANNAQRKRYQAIDYLNRQYELREWVEKIIKKPSLDPSGTKTEDSPDWNLRKLLQNGVIVCQLMKTILPDSIPHIHEASNLSSFKGKENISHFINAVEEFGVPRHRLFEVNDLFLGHNFFKVVECTEHVAAIAQAKGLVQHPLCEVETTFTEPAKKGSAKPPPTVRTLRPNSSTIKTSAELPKPATQTPDATLLLDKRRSWSEAQLKQAEQELSVVGWRPRIRAMQLQQAVQSSANVRKSIALNQLMLSGQLQAQAEMDSKSGPKVRGTIDSKTIQAVEKSISVFQAMVRGRIARRKFQKRLTDAAYREKIVREILETEEVYVANLNMLIKNVYVPLKEYIKQGKPIIKMETLRMMINDSIEVILNYNSKLLADLKARVSAWGPNQAIGDIFMQFGSFLKVYTQYVKDQPKAQAVFDKKKTKKKFMQFLWEKKQAREITMELDSYLILPIQRVPRYTLLLDNLVKHTWQEHPDYVNLRKAALQVADVANYINERKRDRENIDKIVIIMKRITGKFENLAADPRRRFVMEGSVTVIEYTDLENGSPNPSPSSQDTISKSTSTESLNSVSSSKQMKPHERHMYLFNDKLLLTKSSTFASLLKSVTTATEKFKLVFDVATISFREEQHSTTFSIYSHDILSYVANGQPANQDKDKLLMLVVTSSKEERDLWISTFQKYKTELLKQMSRSHEILIKQSQDKADEAKNALAEQYGLMSPPGSAPKETTLSRLKRAATINPRSKIRDARNIHNSNSSDGSPHATNTSDGSGHGSSSPDGSLIDESEYLSSPGSSAPSSRRTSNADMLVRPDSGSFGIIDTPPENNGQSQRKSSQTALSPEQTLKKHSSTESIPHLPTHHTPPSNPLPPLPPGARQSQSQLQPVSTPPPSTSTPLATSPQPTTSTEEDPSGTQPQAPSSPTLDLSDTKVTPEMAKQLEGRSGKDRGASFSFKFKKLNRSISDMFVAANNPNNSNSPPEQPSSPPPAQPSTPTTEPPSTPQPHSPAPVHSPPSSTTQPAQSTSTPTKPAEQGTPLNPNSAGRAKKSWRSFFADQK